jgi:hypothetical protein
MSEKNEATGNTAKAMVEKEGKYLSFNLAGEEYGIGIVVDSVSEVLSIKGDDVDPLPHSAQSLIPIISLAWPRWKGGGNPLQTISHWLFNRSRITQTASMNIGMATRNPTMGRKEKASTEKPAAPTSMKMATSTMEILWGRHFLSFITSSFDKCWT